MPGGKFTSLHAVVLIRVTFVTIPPRPNLPQ